MKPFGIEPVDEKHREWIRTIMQQHWFSAEVVTRGRIHHAGELPGFVAVQEDQPVGLVTYHLDGNECELVSLNSLPEGIGIGSALVEAVKNVAVSARCKRVWVITTNDNLPAVRFYQKRGFTLVAVHRNALEHSRKLKPEIPLIGIDGIPIRDEIELEMLTRERRQPPQ